MSDKKFVEQIIENKKDEFISISDQIWDNPELCFQEQFASTILKQTLKKEEFEVLENVDNIPTAFIGSYGSGEPIIAILGEFDALPNLSQKAFSNKKEVLKEGTPGHGCGHNAIGSGSLAAAIAVKEYLKKNCLPGTIKYFGCPAEESGWSKMFLVRDGFFKNVSAAITWHPAGMNRVLGTGTLANLCINFHFHGKSAHAAGAPHLGRSALDACELMNIGVNYLREHIIPEARVHYAYLNSGGEAPNIVPSHASLKYFIRAPKIKQALEISKRISNIAYGAALMTETKVTLESKAGMCDYIPNTVISEVMNEALFEIGAPNFDKNDEKLAKTFFDTFTNSEIDSALKRMAESYNNTDHLRKEVLIKEIAPFKKIDSCGFGSTDVGDVSYSVPTAQLNLTALANGTPAHSWQVTAQGKTNYMHKALITAGKILALTAIKLYKNPKILENAQNEYQSITGGKYLCPVGKDVKPDI